MRRRLLNGGPALACAALIHTGCAAHSPLPDTARPCPDTRPEACTMEYRPVIGYGAEGASRGEFRNACVACSEPGVAYTVSKNAE